MNNARLTSVDLDNLIPPPPNTPDSHTGEHPISGPRLIIADLENLTGKSPAVCKRDAYTAALHQFLEAIDFDPVTDRLLIGVNPALAHTAQAAAPFARIVTRPGPDGAELRLCRELADLDLITRCFTHVVIASGDVRFTHSVLALAHHGIVTTVATLPGQLARRLRLAAHHIIWLSPPTAGAAANPEEAA